MNQKAAFFKASSLEIKKARTTKNLPFEKIQIV